MTVTVKYGTTRNIYNPGLTYEVDKDDIRNLVIDYTHELGSDTVSTATATTENITAGTPSPDSNVVTSLISAGNSGSTAKLEMKITTSGGKTLTNYIKFRVKDYYENT